MSTVPVPNKHMKQAKRIDLSLSDKILVIEMLQKKISQSAVAKSFGISQSQVSRIWKGKEKLLCAHQKNANPSRKRARESAHVDVEKALLQWFEQAKSLGIQVSGPMLQEKAKEFGKTMNIIFDPSLSWVHRWKKRNGAVLKRQHGRAQYRPSETTKYETKSRSSRQTCYSFNFSSATLPNVSSETARYCFLRSLGLTPTVPSKSFPNCASEELLPIFTEQAHEQCVNKNHRLIINSIQTDKEQGLCEKFEHSQQSEAKNSNALLSSPNNTEVLKALVTIRQKLYFHDLAMDNFICLEKQLLDCMSETNDI